jgi:hypothetical protein
MRSIEDLLLKEFDAAKAAFDEVKETPYMQEQIRAAFIQYIDAMQRLRKFLDSGEIPADIQKKLESRD